MATLEKAIEIAVNAHAGQTDKAGRPYVLHPLWLMHQFEDMDAMMVAVLHDAVEDSSLTLGDLSGEGFPSHIVDAVDAITNREGELYESYIQRVQAHPIALRVKLADLEHNMDIRRMAQIRDRDLARLDKYHKTWKKLRQVAAR
ncbi:MAG: GTP pyrophosphokinase [Rhodothermales bacterium]